MQFIKHISIPEPCSQRWNEMTPVDKGRHCTHCCKTVTDFTAMSNQQIIDSLAGDGGLCGHIDSWQIDSVNRQLATKPARVFSWKGFSLAASLFFAWPIAGAFAQHKHTTYRPLGKASAAKVIIFKTISGIVKDSLSKTPLPGVVISVKGTATHTVTGADGKYMLDIPEHADALVVNFTGYYAQNIFIPLGNNIIDVDLIDNNLANIKGYTSRRVNTLTGYAVISISNPKKPSFFRKMYERLIKQPAKKIFG
ncbi:MAG: carboxypeptidase-like regulatory domain-containing protein [Bacteroidota bacterium]